MGIAQPLLISPTINVSDVAVTMGIYAEEVPLPNLTTLLRRAHPFPILERYLERALVCKNKEGNMITIPAKTQAICFLDSHDKYSWSPFGVGPRACLGTSHGIALLTPLMSLRGRHEFQPSVGHKYSGRNNDAETTSEQDWYFIKSVAKVLY